MINYKYDVFFYEAFEEEQEQLIKYMPENINAGYSWKTIQELNEEMPSAKIISTRTQSIFPLTWAKNLEAILSRSTGYDHLIRYKEATSSDIKTGYLPLYCNRSVAEQGLTLWMALMRKLPVQMKSFKTFHRDGLTGLETEHKNLLVVGVGNIGSEIVKIGQGLGMNVKGVDLVEKFDFVDYTSIESGIANADIIVCSMNLTKDNNNYFNYDLLRKAKKGVVFVNIARGELSHCTGLLKLMKEEHIGGIGIDVYNEENNLASFLRSGQKVDSSEVDAVKELMTYSNVIFTPHNAFNTNESVIRKSEQSAIQIKHLLKIGNFKWDVPEQ